MSVASKMKKLWQEHVRMKCRESIVVATSKKIK
jgi:hypothetical protein